MLQVITDEKVQGNTKDISKAKYRLTRSDIVAQILYTNMFIYKVLLSIQISMQFISLLNFGGPEGSNVFYSERYETKRHPIAYLTFGAG
ncbi:unnamed protein product [Adineta steineri]|uniref:Uncharacterized protein n=1 Tax=Adineta steineri TaxID=433720 RepID=A0A819JDP7_9BILA|nr:unnamed protein product [Adineta steineri]